MVLQLQNALVENLLANMQSSITSGSSSATGFSYDASKYEKLYPTIKELLAKDKPEQRDLDFIVEKMNEINNLDNSLRESSKKRSGTERNDSGISTDRGREALQVNPALTQLSRNIRKQLEYNLNVRDDIDIIIGDRLRDIMQQLSRTHSPTRYEST